MPIWVEELKFSIHIKEDEIGSGLLGCWRKDDINAEARRSGCNCRLLLKEEQKEEEDDVSSSHSKF